MMDIQAEVSIYPLRTREVGPVVRQFLADLERHDVTVEAGTMSSRVRGDHTEVFQAIANAFASAGENNQAVLVLKASNACPESTEGDTP